MRVITGTARGRKLATPAGMDTRPTTEITKEAVFSAIQFEVEGANVLDLFAGSGQMGIEALSRGARHCVFVDNAKSCQTVIRANLRDTGLASASRVVCAEGMSFLKSAGGPFDIAFLDPPYASGLAKRALPEVAKVMRDSGVIFCETDKDEPMPETAGAFQHYREYRYGKVKITSYRVPDPEA